MILLTLSCRRLLTLATCLVPLSGALAVPPPAAAGREAQEARYDLLLRLRDAHSHTVGVYITEGANVHPDHLVQEFLPLANFLSVSSQHLIRFNPDGGIQDLEPTLAHRFYDLVLLPVQYGIRATAHGYQPLDLPVQSAALAPSLAGFAFFYHPDRVTADLVSTLARSLARLLQEPAHYRPLMQGFDYLSGAHKAALHPQPWTSGSGRADTSP